MKDKLSGWKTKCLSTTGRLTLAKTVISNMANFYMQTERLPASVRKEVDRAVRQCVWRASADQRKVHILSWEILCRPKERGEAWLRKAEFMN